MPRKDLRVKQTKMVFTHLQSLKQYQKQATDWEAVLGIANFFAEFNSDEKYYDHSSNIFHA
jgi:hypothetical protein